MSENLRKRRRPTYSEEFKADAVRLVEEQNLTVARAARDLGIHQNTLRSWLEKTREVGEERLDEEERAELARLRREIRILREEREILKKAAAFFAKESR